MWKERLTLGIAIAIAGVFGASIGWGFAELLKYWVIHVSKLWEG